MYEIELLKDIEAYKPQIGDRLFHKDYATDFLTEYRVIASAENEELYLLNEVGTFERIEGFLSLDYFTFGIVLIEREGVAYYLNTGGI